MPSASPLSRRLVVPDDTFIHLDSIASVPGRIASTGHRVHDSISPVRNTPQATHTSSRAGDRPTAGSVDRA